jgi:monoamine oxidase
VGGRSGTAVDVWPSRHPQGDKDGNLTKEQQNAILEICKKYGLRSGGTYKTAKTDWMHIEIDISPAKAAALIASLKGK